MLKFCRPIQRKATLLDENESLIVESLHSMLLKETNCSKREQHVLIAIAAMHGPHSVFHIGHCMVIHCDARGVSLVDQ